MTEITTRDQLAEARTQTAQAISNHVQRELEYLRDMPANRKDQYIQGRMESLSLLKSYLTERYGVL